MDDFHGKADTEESSDCDRVTRMYQSGGLVCRHNLSGLARSGRWNDFYAHRHLPCCRLDGWISQQASLARQGTPREQTCYQVERGLGCAI
jgi:hypothetical protein